MACPLIIPFLLTNKPQNQGALKDEQKNPNNAIKMSEEDTPSSRFGLQSCGSRTHYPSTASRQDLQHRDSGTLRRCQFGNDDGPSTIHLSGLPMHGYLNSEDHVTYGHGFGTGHIVSVPVVSVCRPSFSVLGSAIASGLKSNHIKTLINSSYQDTLLSSLLFNT